MLAIILTLLFVNSENVKWIFPLTDWSQKNYGKNNITFTLFVDLIYLAMLNLLYLTSCEFLILEASTDQITIFLKLPELID